MDPHAGRQPRAPKGLALVLAAVLIAVGGFFFLRPSGDDTDDPVVPSPTASQPPADVTAASVCQEIPADLALRTDSFQRTAETVRADAEALEAAGDTETAANATALADTLDALAAANETQQDTAALLGDLTAQLDALGC